MFWFRNDLGLINNRKQPNNTKVNQRWGMTKVNGNANNGQPHCIKQ